jgi:hypothetical protein
MKNGFAIRTQKTLESAKKTDKTFASTKEMSQHQLEQVLGGDKGTNIARLTSLIDSYIGTLKNKDGA